MAYVFFCKIAAYFQHLWMAASVDGSNSENVIRSVQKSHVPFLDFSRGTRLVSFNFTLFQQIEIRS